MIFFGNYVPSFITDLDILLASREPYNKHRKVRVVKKEKKSVNKEEPKIPREIEKEIEASNYNLVKNDTKKYQIKIDWSDGEYTNLWIYKNGQVIQEYSAPLPESIEDFKGIVNEANKAIEAVNPRKGMVNRGI